MVYRPKEAAVKSFNPMFSEACYNTSPPSSNIAFRCYQNFMPLRLKHGNAEMT